MKLQKKKKRKEGVEKNFALSPKDHLVEKKPKKGGGIIQLRTKIVFNLTSNLRGLGVESKYGFMLGVLSLFVCGNLLFFCFGNSNC